VKTEELLLSHYKTPIIPLASVVRDYFSHLNVEKFLKKTLSGEISLPIVRMERSQKSAKGIHVTDLGAYLDKQTEAARKECRQLSGAAS
jgi:Pyocin activator protein PrtN